MLREIDALGPKGHARTRGEDFWLDAKRKVGDRRNYYMGWDNLEKRRILKNELQEVENEIAALDGKLRDCVARIKSAAGRKEKALLLAKSFQSFDEIDYMTPTKRIGELRSEEEDIRSKSNILDELKRKLEKKRSEIAGARHQIDFLNQKKGEITQRIKAIAKSLDMNQRILSESVGNLEKSSHIIEPFATMAKLVLLDVARATQDEAEDFGKRLKKWLEEQVSKLNPIRRGFENRIVVNMKDYKTEFELESKEFVLDIAGYRDYVKRHDTLVAEDLVKFSEKFKELLHKDVTNEIVIINTRMETEKNRIKEGIGLINDSLRKIEYNKGRYIKLVVDEVMEPDIRDFKRDLMSITDRMGESSEHLDEERFRRIKVIIDRLKGRENHSDEDRRWREKVTDVRNLFEFSASERYMETDEEYEKYTDSGGKSGGQKEKLAYTILAASLAHRFKLKWGETRSNSFRFVMIDEAFGRGSDESARYGLELFKGFNLQLLVVTPLQKIHIIEPYVSSVGYVQNKTGMYSDLVCLTIEEFHELRKNHLDGIKTSANLSVTDERDQNPEDGEANQKGEENLDGIGSSHDDGQAVDGRNIPNEGA